MVKPVDLLLNTRTAKITKHFTEYIQEQLTEAIETISKKDRLDKGDVKAINLILNIINDVDWENIESARINQTNK